MDKLPSNRTKSSSDSCRRHFSVDWQNWLLRGGAGEWARLAMRWVLLLVLSFTTAGAAESSGSSAWVVRSWLTGEGLPQNAVNAILQTRDGFLWVGTDGGLARFDGVRFRKF